MPYYEVIAHQTVKSTLIFRVEAKDEDAANKAVFSNHSTPDEVLDHTDFDVVSVTFLATQKPGPVRVKGTLACNCGRELKQHELSIPAFNMIKNGAALIRCDQCPQEMIFTPDE